MPSAPDQASSTTDKPAPPIRRRFRIFLAIAAIYIALLALVPFGYDKPLFVAMVAGSVIGVCALIFGKFIALIRQPPATEDDFEAEYHSRQQLKSTMVQIADDVYQQAPYGNWQARDVSYPRHGFPKVHEEKSLALAPDGTGTFHFIEHDLDIKCHTTFQFKPAEKGTLLVRLTDPPSDTWTPVSFGFDMGKNAGGEDQLVLWLEADSPLPDDLLMHWPFNERFTRAD